VARRLNWLVGCTSTVPLSQHVSLRRLCSPKHVAYYIAGVSRALAEYLAKQMSQHDIATCLAKRVAEHFARSSGVCSQSRHIAKRLDPVFITSATSSPFNQIDNVNVSSPNSLFALACMFQSCLVDSYFLALAACLWRWLDTNRMTQSVPRS
jgi:hypothetical protein